MNITSENVGGVTVVSSLPSFIDAGNAMEFKAEISTIIGSSPRVVFDMGSVKFIDSAGCGALIASLRMLMSAGGALKLFGVQVQVLSVFELVRMHKLIEIYPTRQEAVLSFPREEGS